MTLAHKWTQDRERRLARWAAAAVPDPGINLKREVLGWRGPPSARPREPGPPPPPEPSLDAPRDEVPPLPEPPPEPVPRLLPETKAQQIIRAVCERFAMSPEQIRSKGRTRRCMVPRHFTAALMRELTNMSSPQIARALGRADHTFALFAIKRVKHLRATDPSLAAHYDELIVQLSTPKDPPGAVQ